MSLKKNFIYNTFYQVLNVITPFITAPYLSRVLQPEGIGIQSYTASIQTFFLMVAVLGTAGYGTREIAQHRDNKSEYSRLFWEIEIMTVFTSGATLLAWFIFCFLSSKYTAIYIVMSFNLLASMLDISWLYSGLEKFKLIVIRSSFFKIAGVILMFLLIKSSEELCLYIMLNAIISVVSAASLWVPLFKIVCLPDIHSFKIKRHIFETIQYFVPNVAVSIYTVLDKTLLGFITGDAVQNGYYEQCEKILNIVKNITFGSIGTVVGVRISYLFAADKMEEVGRRFEYSLNYILSIGIGTVFGIWGVADLFVPIFFGEGYDEVSALLKLFSPIVVIIGISNVIGTHYYTPAGKISQSTKYLIVGAIANVCLNLCLIPSLAAKGAVLASLVAELVITLLFVKYSADFINWRIIFRDMWKKILGGIAMFTALKAFGVLFDAISVLSLAAEIIFGVCVYFAALFLLKDQWCIDRKKEVIGIISSHIKRV